MRNTGLAMFENLNGQFAIAIYDKKLNKLILARDRLGVVPLFYFSKTGICFASKRSYSCKREGTERALL